MKKNFAQEFSEEQKKNSFFAVVASGLEMYDGERQNMSQLYVKLRSGEVVNVKDLPKIDADNPQPNGDYGIYLNLNHSSDVRDKIGEGWLYIGNDGKLHMWGVVVDNSAGREALPLIKNNMMQFSTEGLTENYDEGFLIFGVAPVLSGNDPATQVAKNSKNNKEGESDMKKNQITRLFKEALAKKNAITTTEDLTTQIEGVLSASKELDLKTVAMIIEKIVEGVVKGEDGNDEADMETEEVDSEPSDGMEIETTENDNEAITEAKTEAEEVEEAKNEALEIAKNLKKGKEMKVNAKDFPKVPVANTAEFSSEENQKNYLKSEKFLNDYVTAIVENEGNPKKASNSIMASLKKNAITVSEDSDSFGVLLPDILATKVEDFIKTRGELWGVVNKSGLKTIISALVLSQSTAQGRARGNTAEKTRQDIEFLLRAIQPAQIYKFQTIADQIVYNNGGLTNSALVDYVVDELTQHIVMALEKAILVGGVLNDDTTPVTSFLSIDEALALTDSPFATGFTPTVGMSLPQAIDEAASTVRSAKGETIIVCAKTTLSKIRYAKTAEGFPIYTQTTVDGMTRNFVNGYRVITPEWLLDEDQTANVDKIWIGDFASYQTVGETTPNPLYGYFMRTNEHDFESMINAGGAPTAAKSFTAFSIADLEEPVAPAIARATATKATATK